MNSLHTVLRMILFCISIYCLSTTSVCAQSSGPVTTLILNPGENNPRNSEGDFVKLKDGRLMFVYSERIPPAIAATR